MDATSMTTIVSSRGLATARPGQAGRPEADADRQAASRIRRVMKQYGRDLRARHPILRHQSAIGLGLLLASLAAMVATGALYWRGLIAWWLAIPLAAIAASIAHEIEHDLIHKLYFPRQPWLANGMLGLGWLMRPSTISPWVRRKLHLLHHRISGTEGDIEERAITNGERFGLRRLFMMADGVLALLLRDGSHASRRFLQRKAARAYFPLGWLHFGLWYAFLAGSAVTLGLRATGIEPAWPAALESAASVVTLLVVVWIAPNVLRSFCLNFVSSNVHYFGDVEEGNLIQQTQVANRWWLAPFHLFCFNFGSTHAIHHFWVPEPFYVRQISARVAHRVMRENGVRFNDFGTFARANRWAVAPERWRTVDPSSKQPGGSGHQAGSAVALS